MSKKILFIVCLLFIIAGARADFSLAYTSSVPVMPAGYSEKPLGHFLIRYYPADRLLLEYLLPQWLKIADFLEEKFAFKPAEIIPIEIYPDKSDFSIATTLPEEIVEKSGTVGICKFGKLMIVSPRVLPWGYRWLDTLAHEYTHYLINSLSAGKCPLWLHEGIAHYCDTWWRKEPELSAAEKSILSKTTPDKLIPFERMSPSLVFLPTPEDISLAFAEVKSVLLYLNDFSRVKDLLTKIAAGEKTEPAWESVLAEPWDKFVFNWQKYLQEKFTDSESRGVISEIKNYTIKDEIAQFVGPDARGRVYLGEKLYQMKELAAAERQFSLALNDEPDNPIIVTKLVRCYLAEGKFIPVATELLEKSVAKNPDYYVSYILLGEIYLGNNELEKAKKSLTEATMINPFYRPLHYLLSQVYSRLGLFDLARRELAIYNSY